MRRRQNLALIAAAVMAFPAHAQFEGPSAAGRAATVAHARQGARVGTYVTLTGNVIEHRREDYFTFKDSTGEIRVEIPAGVFGGRKVTPQTPVRITGEVDRDFRGRYVFVKALDLV